MQSQEFKLSDSIKAEIKGEISELKELLKDDQPFIFCLI